MSFNHAIGINTKGPLTNPDKKFSIIVLSNRQVDISIEKGKAYIQYNSDTLKQKFDAIIDEASKEAYINQEISFFNFKIVMQKLSVAHALLYGKGINFEKIYFIFPKKDKSICCDSSEKSWGLFTSNVGVKNLNLPTEYSRFVDVIMKMQTDELLFGKPMIALCSFILSKNSEKETERLSYLWTSMNAFYGELIKRFNQKIKTSTDDKKGIPLKEDNDTNGRALLIGLYSAKGESPYEFNTSKKGIVDSGKMTEEYNNIDNWFKPSKEKKEYHDYFKSIFEKKYDEASKKYIAIYERLYDVLYKDAFEDSSANIDEDFIEILEWLKTLFSCKPYFGILIQLSYYLRNQLLHGSFSTRFFYYNFDFYNNTIAVSNYFMDRFLTERLPDIFPYILKNDDKNEDDYQIINDMTDGDYELCLKALGMEK